MKKLLSLLLALLMVTTSVLALPASVGAFDSAAETAPVVEEDVTAGLSAATGLTSYELPAKEDMYRGEAILSHDGVTDVSKLGDLMYYMPFGTDKTLSYDETSGKAASIYEASGYLKTDLTAYNSRCPGESTFYMASDFPVFEGDKYAVLYQQKYGDAVSIADGALVVSPWAKTDATTGAATGFYADALLNTFAFEAGTYYIVADVKVDEKADGTNSINYAYTGANWLDHFASAPASGTWYTYVSKPITVAANQTGGYAMNLPSFSLNNDANVYYDNISIYKVPKPEVEVKVTAEEGLTSYALPDTLYRGKKIIMSPNVPATVENPFAISELLLYVPYDTADKDSVEKNEHILGAGVNAAGTGSYYNDSLPLDSFYMSGNFPEYSEGGYYTAFTIFNSNATKIENGELLMTPRTSGTHWAGGILKPFGLKKGTYYVVADVMVNAGEEILQCALSDAGSPVISIPSYGEWYTVVNGPYTLDNDVAGDSTFYLPYFEMAESNDYSVHYDNVSIYKVIPKTEITFDDGNLGTTDPSIVVTEGKALTAEQIESIPTPDRGFCKFLGWSETENGTPVDLATYTTSEDVTLYAVFADAATENIVVGGDLSALGEMILYVPYTKDVATIGASTAFDVRRNTDGSKSKDWSMDPADYYMSEDYPAYNSVQFFSPNDDNAVTQLKSVTDGKIVLDFAHHDAKDEAPAYWSHSGSWERVFGAKKGSYFIVADLMVTKGTVTGVYAYDATSGSQYTTYSAEGLGIENNKWFTVVSKPLTIAESITNATASRLYFPGVAVADQKETPEAYMDNVAVFYLPNRTITFKGFAEDKTVEIGQYMTTAQFEEIGEPAASKRDFEGWTTTPGGTAIADVTAEFFAEDTVLYPVYKYGAEEATLVYNEDGTATITYPYEVDAESIALVEANKYYEAYFDEAGKVLTISASGVEVAIPELTSAVGNTYYPAMNLGAVTSDEVSIRVTDETGEKDTSGIRFMASITNYQYDNEGVEEYGFIIAIQERLNGIELTHDNCDNDGVTYVEGKAYSKEDEIDHITFSSDDELTIFTGVVTGIPKQGYGYALVCRPYVFAGNNYYYGEAVTASIQEIAEKIKEENKDYYNELSPDLQAKIDAYAGSEAE